MVKDSEIRESSKEAAAYFLKKVAPYFLNIQLTNILHPVATSSVNTAKLFIIRYYGPYISPYAFTLPFTP